MTLPWRVVGDTIKWTTPREPECVVMLQVLLICVQRYWRRKWRCCASHSVTKDVDDAETYIVLALIVEPSEAMTWTWQIVNKTRRWRSLDCDVWDMTLPSVLPTRTETCSSASEDWLPYWDEAKCRGVFSMHKADIQEMAGMAYRWLKWVMVCFTDQVMVLLRVRRGPNNKLNSNESGQ